MEEDFLVAVELGATSKEQLSEAQLEYVDRIKDKLAKVGALLGREGGAGRQGAGVNAELQQLCRKCEAWQKVQAADTL